MAKYRKKPVVIQAFQWGRDEPPEWFDEAVGDGRVEFSAGLPVIVTLEGRMDCGRDDWIIRGVKGELYPIKDDIFRSTYEAVEE